MIVTITVNNTNYQINLNGGQDISIPLDFDNQLSAFGIPTPELETYIDGGFVGDVTQGGSCNVKNIKFNPHGNGTHTECEGHISKPYQTLKHELVPSFMWSFLTSVSVSEGAILPEHLTLPLSFHFDVKALIIRTLPNDLDKKSKEYAKENPPYLSKELIALLNQRGIEHLLVDLPSVDKSDDALLLAHNAFWKNPQQKESYKTITELIFVPNTVNDGYYLLNLQVAGFKCDAVPSKPILYKLR